MSNGQFLAYFSWSLVEIAHSKNQAIKQYRGHIERLCETAEVEMGRFEVVWRHGQAKQWDQTICSDRWYTAGRYE